MPHSIPRMLGINHASIAAGGVAYEQVLGPNPRRWTLALGFSTAANVQWALGAGLATTQFHIVYSISGPMIVLHYRDWGAAIRQTVLGFAGAGTVLNATEVMILDDDYSEY